jgi:hypothetical protein
MCVIKAVEEGEIDRGVYENYLKCVKRLGIIMLLYMKKGNQKNRFQRS